jgi:DNA-binding SARP family transcriptional activator/predicted RNA-binding Zn ribbon-like protein
MFFRLLGPFEAQDGGRLVPVGSRRQERCLLALLLLETGRVVRTERLIDLLWDGHPPESARGVIHTYVGRLRNVLAGRGVTIATRHDGYLVESGGHALDTEVFLDLARRAADATDATEQVRLYDRALGLWRGPLLADVAGEALRGRLAPALTEVRLSTSQMRAEAQLAMGLHDQVVADVIPLVDEYPTRERLVGLLMLALHRCGRQSEALRIYDVTAKMLDGDLGVAPGPDLRALREQILRRDPRLDRPAAPAYAVRVQNQWLPWNVGGHPALEFCNTYAGWNTPERPGSDWLRSYATLAVWAGYADFTDPGTVARLVRLGRRSPREAGVVLDDARELRGSLYACLRDPGDADAFGVVARYAQAAIRESVFTRDEDGLGRWKLSPDAGLRLPLHAAARSGAELLGDPRRYTVCACPSMDCGWLFLDPSGRRRFCSLATCGQAGHPRGR